MSLSRHMRLLVVGGASLLAISCQSVQKQSSFLPAARAQAPSLTAVNQPAKPSQNVPVAQEPKAQVVPQPLQVDPVGDLIAKVEKEYQAGQENYRAGHLEAAK